MLRCVLILVLYCVALSSSSSSQCEIAQICVADVTEADCFGLAVAPNINVFNCCPGCDTSISVPTPIPDPGTATCEPPANCLSDGRYAPVQCKGDMFVGRCFCSDENGNRIFGQMWRDEASEMTCACSRRRAELEASGRRDVTLHCTPTGDYEQLQCDDGMCWCARPSTGQPTVTPVLQEDMKLLPCYSAGVTGDQYLRRCESVVHALAAIHREQSEHGTSFNGNPQTATFCDYDGSFGSYQVVNGIAYCTGREGTNLGSWQVMLTSGVLAEMNCNCARDTVIYFPERGMTVTESCQANGNYQTVQDTGDIPYCVDSDGYEIACT